MDSLVQARAEVLEQDRGTVATRKTGDRSAGMGAGASLIEAVDRGPIRGPAFDRTEIAALVGRAGTAVARSTPVRRVAALHIEGARHVSAEHDTLGQVARQWRQRLEQPVRHLLFDL